MYTTRYVDGGDDRWQQYTTLGLRFLCCSRRFGSGLVSKANNDRQDKFWQLC